MTKRKLLLANETYDPIQITIEQGIAEAVEAGRLTEEIGRQCIEAYLRTAHSPIHKLPKQE